MVNSIKKRLVTCPQCGNVSEYNIENAFRPFCSERCSLVDLGQWASEGYRIPVAGNADLIDSDDLS
jgi:hypothetical protein